jgi:YrbI family 3-deoxy-D-manno-octulosonate 8-phosphate phosphatase
MARRIASRFNIEIVFFGNKNKLAIASEIADKMGIPINQIVYIGDSDNDMLLLEKADLGIVPADGTILARESANIITNTKGGSGVLWKRLIN